MQKLAYWAAAIVVVLVVTAGALHLSAQAKPAMDDKAAIQALYKEFNDAFNKKDVNGIMAIYAQDVFVFDVIPPREYPNWDAYKKDWEGLFAEFSGPVANTVSDLHITVVGPVAYTRSIDDGTLTAKDGSKLHLVVRSTDVLRKLNGKWHIVQEHNSFPVDPTTGKADMLSKP
jgi:ketosteroid isomerase-like protein